MNQSWLVLSLLIISLLAAACSPALQSTPTALAPTALPATPSPMPATAAPTALMQPTAASTSAVPGDPAHGKKLFATLPCSSCHDVTHPFPGGEVCPNLGNIATEAARIVQSSDYHGQAKDAAGYIRESIVNPNAYIVPGSQYHTPQGESVMPKNFGQTLQPTEIDDLVSYLLTLR